MLQVGSVQGFHGLPSIVLVFIMLSAIRNIIRSSVTPRAVAVGCNFSTGQTLSRGEDRKMMLASVPRQDEGTVGENAIAIDSLITELVRFYTNKVLTNPDNPLSSARMKVFPDGNTQNTLINGAAFKDIPICNIRVSKNNTIITITDTLGNPKLLRSCGIEGFKNTRKGTNIAAQATAISVATVGHNFCVK